MLPILHPMAFVEALAYALGGREQSLEDAAAAGLVSSPVRDLRSAGFDRHHVSPVGESAYDLGRAAAIEAWAASGGGRDGAGAAAVVWSSCFPPSGSDEALRASGDAAQLLDFPAVRLVGDLGLGGATVFGLGQQACTGMLGSIRLAAALLAAEEGWDRVLCVSADRLPAGARYEQSWCLVSDGAAAAVVTRSPSRYRLLAAHHLIDGAPGATDPDSAVGSWFGGTHRLVDELAAMAGLATRDIDWVVPQNTHPAAWQVMAGMLGVDASRVRGGSQERVGHVTGADCVVNLCELEASGDMRSGQRVLMATAGYGLQWQGLLLEVDG